MVVSSDGVAWEIVVVDADNNPQSLPGFLEKGYSSFDV
jgi:hypothetical protein